MQDLLNEWVAKASWFYSRTSEVRGPCFTLEFREVKMASPCFQFINTLPSFFAFSFTADLQPVQGFSYSHQFLRFFSVKAESTFVYWVQITFEICFLLKPSYDFLFLIYSSPSLLRPRASSGPGQNLHSKMLHQSVICCLRK